MDGFRFIETTPMTGRGLLLCARLVTLCGLFVVAASLSKADAGSALGPLPDPSARLLRGNGASEYWTLYIELDSGHRITQRFLLTNAGPGRHTAVAVGHFIEPGRAPYRYENGRRRSRWTLSEDRLFFDIAASHLDLHRPRGQLLITKDVIEIRLHFDFAKSDLAMRVPHERLPSGYSVDILTVAARTTGTIRAPWMNAPLETTGRTWMTHTWTETLEAKRIDRRIDVYAADGESVFYGLQLQDHGGGSSHFLLARDPMGHVIESAIHISETWNEAARPRNSQRPSRYPLPGDFTLSGPISGQITLGQEWLRFDPLDVIPNPFRWFIRRVTRPQEVWADAEIDVTLWSASESPSLPRPDATGSEIDSSARRAISISDESPSSSQSASNSEREIEKGSAVRSVTGVASITFMNPTDRR